MSSYKPRWMLDPHPKGLMKFPFRNGKRPVTSEETGKARPLVRKWLLQVVDKLLEQEKYQRRMPTKMLSRASGMERTELIRLSGARKKVLGIKIKAVRGGPRLNIPPVIVRIIEEMHAAAARKKRPFTVKDALKGIASETGYLVSPTTIESYVHKLNTKNAAEGNPTARIDTRGLEAKGYTEKQVTERILREAGINFRPWREYRPRK